jgi:2-aminoadipate transaminase
MTTDVTQLYSALARSGAPRWEALSSELGGDAGLDPDPAKVTYNFDQGLPSPESIPVDDLKRLTDEVCDTAGPTAFEYFDPRTGYEELVYGYAGLRDQIAARIARVDGRQLGTDGILLTSGSCQAISLAVHGYLEAGDGAVVDAVTFPYATKYMQNIGVEVAYANVDDDGCDPDSVEAQLRALQAAGRRPKLIYVSGPTFQTPTGMTMPLERRERLIEVVQRWGVICIEDGVYRDLRIEGDPLPTLLSLDDSGLVIQADSFSKTVAPGLRLGWAAGTPEAVAALAAGREDLGVSQLIARVMELFLSRDMYDPHVRRASAILGRKRDIAVRGVREHVGDAVSFRVPQGSLYLWLRLADDVDWEAVQRHAFAEGVYCRPGERFSDDPTFRKYLRLQYSYTPDDEMERGIAAFGRAVARSRTAGAAARTD